MSRAPVLLLDDDSDLLTALSELFGGLMERPVVAVSSFDALVQRGEEALACGVAILDVNLGPGLPTGIDALAWLREQGFQERVIFFTGHAASNPVIATLRRQDQVEVLEKPGSLAKLQELVESSR